MDSKKLVTILTVLGITMIVIGICLEAINKVDKARCDKLPPYVFFQDKTCEKIYESSDAKIG